MTKAFLALVFFVTVLGWAGVMVTPVALESVEVVSVAKPTPKGDFLGRDKVLTPTEYMKLEIYPEMV